MSHALAYARINALLAITADHHASLYDKYLALLDLGCQAFDLERGCVARVVDADFEIVATSPATAACRPGTRFPLSQTYCAATLASQKPVGFDRATGSEWECHPCFRQFRLEAYMGARILVDDEPWGTLSFSSPEKADHPHQEEDLLFLSFMAQWLGHELERSLHLEKIVALNKWQQALLDSANLSIFATDPEGRIVSFNKAGERMLGYRAEELIGHHTPTIIHDYDEVVTRALALEEELGEPVTPNFDVFVARARHGLAEEREWTHVRKDGSCFPVLQSVAPVRDADGGLQGFLGIAVDISQRKAYEAQEAIIRANEMSRTVLRAIGEGVVGIEEASPHRIRFLNPAAEALIGKPEGEIIGRPLDAIIRLLPDDETCVAPLFTRLSQGSAFEAMIATAGREAAFPATFISSRTLDEAGLVVVTIRDVTADWEADEQLQLAEQVFEYSPEAILVTDGDGRILRVNPAFTLISGYLPEEAIGKTPRILRSDRHDAAFYDEMWRCLKEEGHWHGEIWDQRKSGEIYPKWLCINRVRRPQGGTCYVALFADISERKAHEERIDYLARHDALTGLSNRRQLEERMDRLAASGRRGDQGTALLLIDLDRFKQVNDSLGHQVGDQLLVEVARRLNGCVRASDMVARLGGDEFVVVLDRVSDHRDVALVAEKIRESVARPVDVGQHRLHTSPSIGISLYPWDGGDLKGLLQAADIAMYQVKAAGRNAWMFFEARMNDEVRLRHQLEADMRLAMERQEFEVYFQPQFDIGGGGVVAWEALLRWQHPQRGWIDPGEFIPVAEESGLIVALGEWVIATACRQAVAWLDCRAPCERVAVNLSPRQIEQSNLLEVVAGVLRDTGLPPQRLELELTEAALMNDTPKVQETLAGFKALGVRLTLDDFGTGYSSLSYLSSFAVDRLKIDRSFILEIKSRPNNGAIIHAMVALAKALGLEVVAEGVETSEQLAFLVESGCANAQGYLYGRPMPAEAIPHFIPWMQKA
ncbi:MAG: EAL domain-containing protein [Rhodocyclaceae bacterium]|nr:EAL domain-containing protein [Rhodocyclaceae bacterium]